MRRITAIAATTIAAALIFGESPVRAPAQVQQKGSPQIGVSPPPGDPQSGRMCPADMIEVWNWSGTQYDCLWPDGGASPSPFEPPSSVHTDPEMAAMYCTMFSGIYFDGDYEACMEYETGGGQGSGEAWASR